MQLIYEVSEMSLPRKYHFEDSMCRTCLHTETECLLSIYEYCGDESKNTRIVELLCSSTPLVIQIDDALPKTICTACKDKLLEVHEFQQMCLRSDQQLQSEIQYEEEGKPGVFETTVVCSPPHHYEDNDEDCVEEVSNYLKLEINEKEDRMNPLNSEIHTKMTNVTDDASPNESNGEHSDWALQNASAGRRKLRKRKKTSAVVVASALDIKAEENSTASSGEELLGGDLKIIPCSDCGQSFRDRVQLSEHKRVHNQEEKRYACEYCKCRYFRSTHLRRHERKKHPDQYLKSAFANTNSNVPAKRKTRKSVLVAAKLFECEIEMCGEKFKSSSSLARHTRAQHKQLEGTSEEFVFQIERAKPFVCKHCNKAFQQSCTLKDHIRTHTGEQPFLCSECGKAFNSSSNMKQHLLRHTGEKRYECPACPKKFPCLSDLASHKAVHNKVKRHICDLCGAAFGKPYQLKKHKMYHNNDRPHKCEYCEQRFVCADHMRRHMRTHTGEKPYKCKYCERAFAQSNDLIKHLRSHLGENVYKCELCPLAFRLATELRTHFAAHKSDDNETRQRNLKALLEQEAEVRLSLAEKQQSNMDVYT